MSKSSEPISQVATAIKPDVSPKSHDRVYTASPRMVAMASEPEPSVFQNFNMDFTSRSFTAGQNDAWMYFSPSAMVNPETHSLDLYMWLNDLAEVDIRPMRFRYEFRFLEVLQIGLQSYAIAEKTGAKAEVPNLKEKNGHHSTYVSLKYLIVDESVLPINIALGVRKRILWDENNTDFRSRDEENKATDPDAYDKAEEIDQKNDQYNDLTLQAMITGKIEPIGVLYNVYLDSMTLGTGIKFVVTPDIKILFDSVYYYRDNPPVSYDSAVGIQFYNPVGSTDLVYQAQTEQFQLGLCLRF